MMKHPISPGNYKPSLEDLIIRHVYGRISADAWILDDELFELLGLYEKPRILRWWFKMKIERELRRLVRCGRILVCSVEFDEGSNYRHYEWLDGPEFDRWFGIPNLED